MRLVLRQQRDAVIVDVIGAFDPGTDDVLAAAVAAVTLQGFRKVVVNLLQGRGWGTTAITALVRALGVVGASGAELKLVGRDRRFERLLRIVGLYTCFDLFETEEEALDDFHPVVRYLPAVPTDWQGATLA